MGIKRDIWRTAVIEVPIETLIAAGGWDGFPVRWLGDDEAHRFVADPFGLWRDGRLHVFGETYDYRERHGRIECLTLDSELRPVERRLVLSEPWHLSYPYLVEAEGETWMLPEAFRSGALTLYRAVEFPYRWEAAGRWEFERPPIDAMPFFHDGVWWLFHAAGGTAREKVGVLHLAWAERLTGPWHRHPMSPVRHDMASARLGGTPCIVEGRVALPMQDCRETYGGAIQILYVDRLTRDRFEASLGPRIAPPASFAPYVDGLHTLSAAGPVTLIDAKRLDNSLIGLAGAARGYLRKRYDARNRATMAAPAASKRSGP